MQSTETRERILFSVKECQEAIAALQSQDALDFIEKVSGLISACFEKGNKLLVAGNGGSFCDAMHFTEELTGFFRKKRKPLPALCLGDVGHLSCVSNDAGFEFVFSRLVESLGQAGDCLCVLSTSGNSDNLIRAVESAKEKGIHTVAFLGKTGGNLKGLCDIEWIVEGFLTSDRIQEAHMASIHILIEMIEHNLNLSC